MRLLAALATVIFFSCVVAQTYKDECGCYNPGTVDNTCDSYRTCNCKTNFGSDKCDKCADGYYWFPKCLKGCYQCQIIAAGFTNSQPIYPEESIYGVISPYAYRLFAPGESTYECYNDRVDLDRFITQVGYRNILGGIVEDSCYIWAYPADGPAIGYKILSNQEVIETGEPDPIGVTITHVVQAGYYGLVGLTNQFSVYILRSDLLWDLRIEFPGEQKQEEWGNILCATYITESKIAIVTTGSNSRILFLDIDEDRFTEGPRLDGVTGTQGTCAMLDEEKIFIASTEMDMHVCTASNATLIENYFERNDLPEYIGTAKILKGDFGHVLFGGYTDGVFYLPHGTRSWIRSEQRIGDTFGKTVGCLFNS